MKTSTDEQLSRRFYLVTAFAAMVIVFAVAVSISQFGKAAWQEQKQIGYIMQASRETPGWYRAHYRGIKEACDEMGYDLVLRDDVPQGSSACVRTVEELAGRGVRVIFLTNSELFEEMKPYFKNYPGIQFYTTEESEGLPSVNRYLIRFYEPAYLAGMMAGFNTKTNVVGYIAPLMGRGKSQGINAFAMGVRRSNPQAQVLLFKSDVRGNGEGDAEAVYALKAEHVDVIGYQHDGDTIPRTANQLGMGFISFNGSYSEYSHCIASIHVDWKAVYLNILRENSRQSDYGQGHSGKIYSAVAVSAFSRDATARERTLMETERWRMKHGMSVFKGEIYDQEGRLRCGKDETLGENALWSMDWIMREVRILGRQ